MPTGGVLSENTILGPLAKVDPFWLISTLRVLAK
jgi:hypothetical protein